MTPMFYLSEEDKRRLDEGREQRYQDYLQRVREMERLLDEDRRQRVRRRLEALRPVKARGWWARLLSPARDVDPAGTR